MLKKQPRFSYKYLSRYTAASFSRNTRLAAVLNHYQFLDAHTRPGFFEAVARQPVLWQQQHDNDLFTIALSFPQLVGFEGELSLSLLLNGVLVQVIAFVIVPGRLVGGPDAHALLISQVQGARNATLLRTATKALLDITPAMLLVNAAYGLAQALGIGHAVGISTAEQLSQAASSFSYDSFWQQFDGQRTADNLFLLSIPAPEKPIQQVKANHRARTLRKRQYKQALRGVVAQYFEATFLK